MSINRRTFLQSAGLAGAAMLAPSVAHPADSRHAAKTTVLSNHGCGRATGYAEANKIVTVGDKTHVSWIDSVEQPAAGFRVRIRTLDRKTGEWSPTYTVGEGYDNHGGPALTVDSKGYLHIAYYPHHHAMRYRKSAKPNDASAWDDEERFGERCTYPTLVCGPDDTLYLTCRQSNDRNWLASLFTKQPGEPWRGPTPLLRSRVRGYSHFQEALAWGPKHGELHLSTRIHERANNSETVGYMVSSDFGKTWRTSAGKKLELPVTADTIDRLATKKSDPNRLRCGAVAVSPDGKPHVLYSSFGDNGDTRGDAIFATPDGKGGWRRRSLLPAMADAFPDHGVKMPGGLTFNQDGRLFIVLTTFKADPQHARQFWGSPSNEVVLLEARGDGDAFSPRLLSEPDENVAHWLPNMERPTGHNAVTGTPGVIFTDGGRGENNRQILANKVRWVQFG